jgi:hypothetical protein
MQNTNRIFLQAHSRRIIMFRYQLAVGFVVMLLCVFAVESEAQNANNKKPSPPVKSPAPAAKKSAPPAKTTSPRPVTVPKQRPPRFPMPRRLPRRKLRKMP